ncbi:alpha-glucosidase [Pseudorhodoferax sp. Leaf267]|uniref:alpha-glucosidase n=1 Tax=Pseudorhodoferax sp. Leaf267 TaxID=1736316 RepID=UPI0006F4FFDC|nr:alpha-glucosidase [Pseudorhodoferax sp. Leaf267]KQP20586.1 alpha-glucosidase [Pseudorhodoferax sp. Leaf267]
MSALHNEWWRGGVIYQVYPRSFADGNGDGIGDLPGITARLEHIAGLGVDAVWLSPFFKSPQKDFGYDVSDYRDVDPMYGTLADFDALVAKAHGLGLKVMIDQVLSHCSDQHAWFAESRASKGNPKADWFVWADAKHDGTPPNNWLSVFGGSAWQWDTRRCQYYLHNFLVSQPDLNLHNPEVQDALLAEVRFWLERGVDGYRLDAINFCCHDRQLRDNPGRGAPAHVDPTAPAANPYSWQVHQYDKSQPEALDFLRRLRKLVDAYADTTMVGEIGDEAGLRLMAEYTGGGDKLHMAYCFDLLGPVFDAPYVHGLLTSLHDQIADGWPCWAISNHDCVRVATRWGGKTPAPALLRQVAALLLTLRGSACIYQGEELGLPEADIALADLQDPYGITMWPEFKGRDGCRTPMAWQADAPDLGFGSGAAKPWLPLAESHRALAADRQQADPGSLLHHYRRLLQWRRTQPALVAGAMALLPLQGDVLAFERSQGAQRLLCVFNISEQAARYEVAATHWELAPDAPATTPGTSRDGNALWLAPHATAFLTLRTPD